MIISASYKTDIPAFYARWFFRRLEEGYCRMLNPYSHRPVRVDLRREAVDGFVFWTKNFGPFFEHLDRLRAFGVPFVVQYTITGYPQVLETSVIDAARSIEHMNRLSGEFGPRAAVWRYDTILFTTLTDRDFHRRNFERLARALEHTTDEVVISFAQVYRKTRRNLNAAAQRSHFEWWDPEDDFKRSLTSELVGIARARGMQLTVCAQRGLVVPGAGEARCIDARRLISISGRLFQARQKGNRPDCMCDESRDIGDYDTCPHGCVYCYAVQHKALAQSRYKRHDPDGEFLFPPEPSTEKGRRASYELPLSPSRV